MENNFIQSKNTRRRNIGKAVVVLAYILSAVCAIYMGVMIIKGIGITVSRVTQDGIIYERKAFRDYYEVVSCNDKSRKSIVVADKINDKSVSVIGDYAFKGCSSAENIVLPQSIEKIGKGAFSGCIMLDYSFVIPKSVKKINDDLIDLFIDCEKMIFGTNKDKMELHYEGTKEEFKKIDYSVWGLKKIEDYGPKSIRYEIVVGGINILYIYCEGENSDASHQN